jgi:RNA-directed DNA polymerase
MKVQHGKDLASHSGPESCGGAREGAAEALTGETGGSAIEPRNPKSGTPTPLSDAEGEMNQGDTCESWSSPARSETLHTPGSFLHRSWEISAVPGETTPGGSGKAKCHTPDPPAVEKSDALILPGKPSNKGDQPAEMVEGRSAAKGNADQDPAPRTQSRTSCA